MQVETSNKFAFSDIKFMPHINNVPTYVTYVTYVFFFFLEIHLWFLIMLAVNVIDAI